MILEPGQKFGRLTIVSEVQDPRKGRHYLVQCDCGSAPKVVLGTSMSAGRTKGCGCLAAEYTADRKYRPPGLKHGHARDQGRSPTYGSWSSMRARCLNERHHKYSLYGGRGIAICERWATFGAFLADMGERPSGTTLDRIDGAGDYEPGNCRWATVLEQNRNRRLGAQAHGS